MNFNTIFINLANAMWSFPLTFLLMCPAIRLINYRITQPIQKHRQNNREKLKSETDIFHEIIP